MRNEYLNIYINFLKKFIKVKKPLKVVFDCSNGSAGLILKPLLHGHKFIKAKFINGRVNGNFPAHGPNPLADGACDQLIVEVKKQKADLGIILDNDGDRVFFMDETGRLLTATESLIFLGNNFKGSVIVDFMIGPLAYEEFGKQKRKIITSRVGTYFIKKTMREKRVGFAGEYSGHYYFKDFFGSDSGVMAAIIFMNQLSSLETGKVSNWLSTLPRYHQIMFNTHFEREKFSQFAKMLQEKFSPSARKISDLDGIKFEFDQYWFNFRLSNTEDLLRLTIEAQTPELLQQTLQELKHMLI